MILTGIGDEAGAPLDAQIKAARQLGWSHLEMRAVELPGFARGNLHDIPEQAFELAAARLQEAGVGVTVSPPPSLTGPPNFPIRSKSPSTRCAVASRACNASAPITSAS